MALKKVAIIGCGLIGGSMGKALKRRRPDTKLICLDLEERLGVIANAGFADEVGTLDDSARHLGDADIVILASPVEAIIEQMKIIAPHLREGTLVTDVGGTKSEIMRKASAVLSNRVSFIGGHPIAGSEKSGVEAANPSLFAGRVYVLCPFSDTPPEALLKLIDLVEDLEAVPLTIEPEEHDRILAMVSHVPQILSIALMHAALEEDGAHSLLDVTVGQGFLDLTRIASSEFEQWKSVLATNREPILEALDRFVESLATVRQAMTDGEVGQLWTEVSQKRRRMTVKGDSIRKG